MHIFCIMLAVQCLMHIWRYKCHKALELFIPVWFIHNTTKIWLRFLFPSKGQHFQRPALTLTIHCYVTVSTHDTYLSYKTHTVMRLLTLRTAGFSQTSAWLGICRWINSLSPNCAFLCFLKRVRRWPWSCLTLIYAFVQDFVYHCKWKCRIRITVISWCN